MSSLVAPVQMQWQPQRKPPCDGSTSPSQIETLLVDSEVCLADEPTYAELLAEHTGLKHKHAALERENEALKTRSEQNHSTLALARALIDPLDRLEKLIKFEEVRCENGSDSSPVLPALIANLHRFHEALELGGVLPIAPDAGDTFEPGRHALARARAKSVGTAAHGGGETGSRMTIVECVQEGLIHTPSNTVLRHAVVTAAKPKPAGAASGACFSSSSSSSSSSSNAPNGGSSADSERRVGTSAAPVTEAKGCDPPRSSAAAALLASVQKAAGTPPPREHLLAPGDTMQGIALRYGVSPAAIARLNRLPVGDSALHLRTKLLIPHPPAVRATIVSSHGSSRAEPIGLSKAPSAAFAVGGGLGGLSAMVGRWSSALSSRFGAASGGGGYDHELRGLKAAHDDVE